MAEGNEEMLINLTSPDKCNNVPHQEMYLKNPLIPGPDVNYVESNNPFDIVANNAENWDPFELVLRESLKKIDVNSCLDHDNQRKFSKPKVCKTPSPRRVKTDKTVNPRKVLRSQSVTDNILCFSSPTTSFKKVDSGSPKPLDDICSLREKIKKVVKRRVSECIESALNPSLSQPDLRKTGTSSTVTANNILSQIACVSPESKADEVEIVREKTQNNCFHVQDMNMQNISFIPPVFENLNKSLITQDMKLVNDSIPPMQSTKKEELFEILEGAKQMSITLHNMSLIDTCKNDSLDSVLLVSNDENLMDVKPPWEENDENALSSESEDSSLGLPKIKLFYMKKKETKQNEITAEELAHYKNRIRASLDGNISCDEEVPSDKCVDLPNSEEKENSPQESSKAQEPFEAVAVSKPTAVPPEVSDLRPKKRGNILKKGPMKALVPLQKMTKSIAQKMSSPLKKSSKLNGSCIKTKQDNSFSSSLIYPVAASTPNARKSSKNTPSETPRVSKTSTRASRKDNETTTGTSKRSTSLTSDSRNSNGKLPFSSVDSNVKTNKNSSLKRPHTAPSKTERVSYDKPSPKSKDNSLRKNVKTLASNDKENRIQVI